MEKDKKKCNCDDNSVAGFFTGVAFIMVIGVIVYLVILAILLF